MFFYSLKLNCYFILPSDDNKYQRLKNELTGLKMSRFPGAERCQAIYNELLEENGGNVERTNFVLFQKLRSCQEAGYLLGHHDQDCGSSLETFIKRHFSFILAIFGNTIILICLSFFIMVAKTAFYMIDIVKDVKFINLFNTKRNENENTEMSGLLDVGLAAAIGFLICSELFKMWQLYDISKGASMGQRVLLVVLSPFQVIPLLIHHYERKLELRQHHLCAIAEPNDQQMESLTETKNELSIISRIKGEHRSTENVLEHLVQFIISVAVLVGSIPGWYNQPVLDLSNSDFMFSIVSAVISLVSMVRGQINLINSQKNGQLGFLATLLLGLYMFLAVFTRALVIFFAIVATYQITDKISYAHLIFLFTTLTVALLHILFSFLIQRRLLNGSRSNLKQALWSFLTTPVTLDWDSFYWQENEEVSIPECWRRSRNSYLWHNLLTLVGNLVLGIPLYIWIYLESKESWFGYWELSFIFTLTTVIWAIVSQAIILGLGFIYFKYKHPWSRILKAELKKASNPDNLS